MHITPMLLSAKSVNSSSFSYSIFTTPEQSIETHKKYLYCCEQVEQLQAVPTKCLVMQSPVSLRLLYTARNDSSTACSQTMESVSLLLANRWRMTSKFKRIWAVEQTS